MSVEEVHYSLVTPADIGEKDFEEEREAEPRYFTIIRMGSTPTH
jgi:hypothetical protein